MFRTLNGSLLALSLITPLALSAACSTSTTADSGVETDSGGADSAVGDSGETDGGDIDSGNPDGGGMDSGSLDSGSADSGAADSGPMDSSAPDTSRPDAGMCVDPPSGGSRPVAYECSDCRLPGPGASGGDCAGDADCTMGDNGRCVFARFGSVCSYDECFKDSDCAVGELCACDGGFSGGNACITAGCHVDADCGGYECSPTLGSCGHYTPPVAYYCHTATDACYSDADCGAGYCAFDPASGLWGCSTSECAG